MGRVQIIETTVAGRLEARMDFTRRHAGRVWYARHYFVVRSDIHFIVGCGSSVPEEDEELFAAVAERKMTNFRSGTTDRNGRAPSPASRFLLGAA